MSAPVSASPPAPARGTRRASRWLAAAGAVVVAGYGLSYLARGDRAFVGPVAAAFRDRPWGIFVHALFGSLVLLAIPLQFAPGLRARRPRLHRAAGRVYVAAGLATAGAGLYMAFHAYGGPTTRLGFALLALASAGTTALALRAAVRRQFAEHQRWALRSAALFFSAVTLRVELPLLVMLFEGRFRPAYMIVAWLCWVPNVLWAEWRVRRARRAAPAYGSRAGVVPGAPPPVPAPLAGQPT